MGTALKEGLPLKLVKKQGDAVSAAVVCGQTYGGYSLNHLELCGQFFVWGSQTVTLLAFLVILFGASN